jgi:hypothetical protein
VEVDFDDTELAELACEGVESMLIDWQGGFLGKKVQCVNFVTHLKKIIIRKTLL